MRDEDTDWTLYHVIQAEKEGYTVSELIDMTGLEEAEISGSLERLERVLLIDCIQGRYQACSIEEFIIKSQVNQDPNLGLEIKGGVIRVKNPDRGDI